MVQKEILGKYPQANIQVYAVWFNMIHGDSRDTWNNKILLDPRVTHYWDEERLVGKWLGQNDQLRKTVTWGGIPWDVFLLYGPEAHWEEAPQPLLAYGRPIVAYVDELIEKLNLLLE